MLFNPDCTKDLPSFGDSFSEKTQEIRCKIMLIKAKYRKLTVTGNMYLYTCCSEQNAESSLQQGTSIDIHVTVSHAEYLR